MDAVLYIILGFIILYFILRRDSGKHKPIPGPQGWPLVGFAPCMNKGEEYKIFSNLAERFGDIYKLNVFGQTIIVLNSAELIRKAFIGDKCKKFINDRSATFVGKYILSSNSSIIFNTKAFDSDHGKLRKAFAQGLNVYGEGQHLFEDNLTSELVQLVDRIQKFQDKEFHMLVVLRRSLTNVFSIILGGHDLKDDDKDVNIFWDFDEAGDFLLTPEVNLVMMSFPFLRFTPGQYKKEYEKILAAKKAILRRFFYEKKATYKEGEVRCFVDFFIGEQLEAEKDGRDVIFTDERIMALTLETVGAATGTAREHGESSQTFVIACNPTLKQSEHGAHIPVKFGRHVTVVLSYLSPRRHLNWRQTDWYQVLSTDESLFTLSNADGIMTSLSTLSSLLVCLLNYPEYQVKIQAELDRVVGRERPPTIFDRRDCVFIEAVVLETLRYLTVAPLLLLPHYCEKGVEFEGYQVPPKSLVMANVWHIHHDEKVWGDPWTFRPERWLDDSGYLLPNDHILRKR